MAFQEPSEVSLNPIASPTNQFAPAEVRRKLPGSQLIALGQALGDVSGQVGQIADTWMQKQAEGQRMQGEQFAQQHAADAAANQQAFKSAVAAGKVQMADSPWFMVGAKQTIARNSAVSMMGQAKNDLYQSPLANQDDPAKVDQFLRERIQQHAQGMDAWEATAAMHESDAMRQRILSEWTDYRRQGREDDVKANSQSLIRQRLDAWNPELTIALGKGDPDAQKNVNGMIAATQGELQNLGSFMPWSQANSVVLNSVLQTARDHRDPEIAQSILDGLRGKDGVQLSKTAAAKAALNILPREIEQLNHLDLATEFENRQLRQTKQSQDLIAWGNAQGIDNWASAKINLSDLGQHAPMAKDEYMKQVAQAAAEYEHTHDSAGYQKLDPDLREFMEKAHKGELGQGDQQISLNRALALLGSPGQDSFNRTLETIKLERIAAEGVTDPAALAHVALAAADGSLKVQDVLSMKGLDASDRKDYTRIANAIAADKGKSVPMVASAIDRAQSLVRQAIAGEGKFELDSSKGNAQLDETRQGIIAGFYNDLSARDGWGQTSLEDKQKQIDNLVDTVAHNVNGNAKDWKTYISKFGVPSAPPATAKPLTPTPAPTEPQTPEERQKAIQETSLDHIEPHVLDSTRKALSIKPEASLREVVEAWEPALKSPPPLTYAPPTVAFNGENYQKLGAPETQSEQIKAMGLDKFTDLRQLRSAAFPSWYDPTQPSHDFGEFHTVSIRKGIDSPEARQAVEGREIELWKGSMSRLMALKPQAMQAEKDMAQITQQFQQTGTISPEQQAKLRSATITRISFSELQDQVGYTPEEVKAAGPFAWTGKPMFANPTDLAQRGAAVRKFLNIPETSAENFKVAQLQLMRLIREGASQ